MPPAGPPFPYRESIGLEPIRQRRDGGIGCAETRTVLRRREPAMVLRRLRILLVREEPTERLTLLRCLRNHQIESPHAQRTRRLPRVEPGLREAVDMPGQRQQPRMTRRRLG